MPTSQYNTGAGYFLYVGDISEVYNYSVPQGNTMFFMNKTQPVMYLKSVNMFNQQTVTTYDLLERKAEIPTGNPMPVSPLNIQNPQAQSFSNGSEYVTKAELSTIIQETIRNELRNGRKNYNKKEE